MTALSLLPSPRLIAAAVSAVLVLGPLGVAAQTQPEADRRPAAKGADDARGGLSAELMYRLLVGDIAFQRGEPALAARAYYEAAREVRDARIARRATEFALAARQRSLATDAARLWAELEPTAERPKQIIAGLTSGARGSGELLGSGSEIRMELERALAEAGSSQRLGEAFLQLNRLLSNEPDKTATLKLVQAVAQPYSKVPEAQFAIALAALNAGLADGTNARIADDAVNRALAQKPGWEQAVLLKAEIIGKESLDKAADYLVDYLKTSPDAKIASSALAQIRIQQKRYAEGAAILQALWEKDKTNHEYQFGMAMLAVQMKDWARAESLFEELKRADYGEEGLVDLYLAQMAEETGRYELALERYRAVPEGERGWIAKLRAGAMLGKLGRVDEARRYLADLPAVTIEQRIQVAQSDAQVLRDAGDNKTAYTVLSDALVTFPDDPDLLYDLAMVAEKLDKIDDVEAKLKRLIELKPENAHALNALGYTLVDRTPRVAEGLALIEQALKILPDDPFILDSVGWAHFRMGELDAAEKHLRRALDQRPDPEIAAHLGEVLWAKGDRVRAQDVWQSQLKTAPTNAVLLETVRRLTR